MPEYLRLEDEFRLKKQQAQAELLRAQQGGDDPANIKEWSAYQKMTPEQRSEYLTMKRASQIMNLGGTQQVYDPLTGGVSSVFQVTPKPEDMPEFKGAQEAAKTAAGQGLPYGAMPMTPRQVKEEEGKGSAAAAQYGSDIKKAAQANQSLSILDKAEALLPQATGSWLGTGLSAAKAAVGKSDITTQTNEQLKLLSGWLVSNVPRMEGPQSNFDVQNYQKMAADLGNSMKPVGDRLAALQGLRSLQEKYAALNQGGQDPLAASQQAIEQFDRENPGMVNPNRTMPKPQMGNAADIEFKLRKQGFSPSEINEYMKAKGYK